MNNLLEAVLASDNLVRAWERVKSNQGAPGIDGVTIEDWPAHARAHWPTLRQQINDGRYWPQAVRRVENPKADGGKRLLGVVGNEPTVTDRVVQQAIAQVLTPIFDPTFSDSSFGFRPGRNAHQAIRQVQATVKDGRRIAVDLDCLFQPIVDGISG